MIPRLVLYSDQIAPLTDEIDARMRTMLPAHGTIGYIPSGPDPERLWFQSRVHYYARYNFHLTFFGLEDEFDDRGRKRLFDSDAIHLTGGNTFQFLHWLRRRGMIDDLKRYVERGGILIGVSAGAILMTPNIESSILCGDSLYPGLDDNCGLGLVPFEVFPHFIDSPGHNEALSAFSRRRNSIVIGVPDGSGIVVSGTEVEILGPVLCAESGDLRNYL